MDKQLLIHGGIVVSESGASKMDIFIEGEKIKALGLPGYFSGVSFDEVINAEGKYVLPGLIDPHVHFNAPFMGTKTIHDYRNGTVSAAFGGNTTLINFSTQPKGGFLLDNLAQQEEEARGNAVIDWSMHGILLDASQQTLDEIPRLIEVGVPTYKCFTTYKHSGRMMDDEGMLKVMEVTAKYGGLLMIHCENDAILEYCLKKEVEAKHFEWIYHAHSRPPIAENEAIRRVITMMGLVNNVSVYIAHTSTAESADIIQDARMRGLRIHSETCPHYLILTEEVYLRMNGDFFICSPPIRKKKDVDALWQAIMDGRIEAVTSDDAGLPSTDRVHLSKGRFDKVPTGMPGVEPRLSVLYTEGVRKNRIDISRLVQLTSTNPARMFGMYPKKGILEPGSDADVVLFNPNTKSVMSAKSLHMNTDFCPFEGMKVFGKVVSVLSRGDFVIRDGELVADYGHGKRVFRKLNTSIL